MLVEGFGWGLPAEGLSGPVGAHNSVVGADQGLRAPSGDQESVRDSVHEDSASARIAAGRRPRQSFREPTRSRRMVSTETPSSSDASATVTIPVAACPVPILNCRRRRPPKLESPGRAPHTNGTQHTATAARHFAISQIRLCRPPRSCPPRWQDSQGSLTEELRR